MTDLLVRADESRAASRRTGIKAPPGPDLAPSASKGGPMTIVFTDIESSTVLNERLGDARWRDILKEHIALVGRLTAAHGGKVVERAGDGFMLAFSGASDSLRCAIELQHALHSQETPERPIRIRIGGHTGEPIQEADAFFGRDVTYAARVASAARGGEILASSALRELTQSSTDISFSSPREVDFKGFDGRHKVWPIRWASIGR